MDLEQIRDQNIALLNEAGFKPAEWLPIGLREGKPQLRPLEEIGSAGRPPGPGAPARDR